MKKKVICFIVIIVIILFCFFLFYLYFKGQKWSSWNVYENSRYGFSLKYPPNWQLGEAETNNAGREMIAPGEEVICYAYGFSNALTNEQGKPQNLEEFISWLMEDPASEEKVLGKKETLLAGQKAIYLLTRQPEGMKDAIYTLNGQEGLGLFCTYENESVYKRFGTVFESMARSFKSNTGSDISFSGKDCTNLLNGTVEPFKDLQTFTDEKYTEVTITSRENWDKKRLPAQVIGFENKNYKCYPMPLEFSGGEAEGSVMPEPSVTKVEWTCESKYDDWKYLKSESSELPEYKKQGFDCEKQECFSKDSQSEFVWLCRK